MLPLSNDAWDIQFQSNEVVENTGRVNIGWYFAKSTPATIEFFNRSYQSWSWAANPKWDQTYMNAMLLVMEKEEHSLRVHRLWSPNFQNLMLYDWQGLLFGHEVTATAFIEGASMIHFTCIEQNLKTYFGLNFGGFSNIEEYYSSTPPLLVVANVSGLVESIHAQVSLAAQLAIATGRTLIWPDSVNLIQKRVDPQGSVVEYQHQPTFPGIRVVSYVSAVRAGIKSFEGRYLSNRQTQSKAVPLQEVLIDASKLILDGGPAMLESHVAMLRPMDVAVIDFANFAHGKYLRKFSKFLASGSDSNSNSEILANLSGDVEAAFQLSYNVTGMREYSAPTLEKIEKCDNANDALSICLDICHDKTTSNTNNEMIWG